MRGVRWIRGRLLNRSSHVDYKPSLHSAEEVETWQLRAFNEQWRGFSNRVPFWKELKGRRSLPDEFRSWRDICARIPLTERRDFQSDLGQWCDPRRPEEEWRATGGSTGQPVRFGIWRSETKVASEDMWTARSWFGISPADKAFLIWGHSHLLGSGWRGWLRGQVRACKDRLAGYRRWSAYRIGDHDLRQAAQELLRFRPSYVLGYSVALDRFGRANRAMARQFHALNLKAVIATAESFPRPDSRETLEEVFGCRVVMEYGTVEAGPIAHEASAGNYRVFWRHHFAELLPSSSLPGAWEIAVTSLFPRKLPLIRYRTGDLIIHSNARRAETLIEFQGVQGRCNDTIALPDGRCVHSEVVAHVLRDARVTGFQFVQKSFHDLKLSYTASIALSGPEIHVIREKLARVDFTLREIDFDHVETLTQTVAGKTRAVRQISSLAGEE